MSVSKVVLLFSFAVVLVAVGAALIYQAQWVYATPERETCFLKAYNPNELIERFASSRWILPMEGGSSENLAGYHEATYKRTFQATFVIRADDQRIIMADLVQDLFNSLRRSGAQILRQTSDENGGVKFEYSQGRSIGSVALAPLRQVDPNHLGGSLSRELLKFLEPNEIPVDLVISAKETWKE